MAIEAAYAANEYMKAKLVAANLDPGDLYPGAFAPSVEDNQKFVTYTVISNDTYDLPGLKRDIITYRFYNPDFDQLQKTVRVVRSAFNVYDIEDTLLSEDGIIFQEAFLRVMTMTEASFAEGVDYYTLNCELLLQYTEEDEVYS